MATYRIVRFYQQDREREIIQEGLTKQEAQDHCNDPETQSGTCTTREGLDRTDECGPWFDGFEKED